MEENINVEKGQSRVSSEKCLSLMHDHDYSDKRLEKDNSADSHPDNSKQTQKSPMNHMMGPQGCTERSSEQHAELSRSRTTEGNGCTFHKCEDCGKILSTSYNLLMHRNIHTDVRPYICSICDKSFRSASGRNRHMRDVHEGVKNFACDVCGRCFASGASRDDHKRTHSGERPYVCETCGKSFKQKASLHVHQLYHSEDQPYRCDLCDRRFRRKQDLDGHTSCHSDQKPYTCDICNKCFRRKSCVARHRRTHADQRSHVCPICNAKFNQQRYMERHLYNLHRDVSAKE